MNELIMPQTVATQLQGLPHPVNLCDAAGKTLGCFVPMVDRSLYEVVGPEPTNEEFEQVEKSSEWYSTNELLGQLEKLG